MPVSPNIVFNNDGTADRNSVVWDGRRSIHGMDTNSWSETNIISDSKSSRSTYKSLVSNIYIIAHLNVLGEIEGTIIGDRNISSA